jgi:hypothetical protein
MAVIISSFFFDWRSSNCPFRKISPEDFVLQGVYIFENCKIKDTFAPADW